MESRFNLISSGLYPETLPPCFTAKDATRAFKGIVKLLDDQKFHQRKTEYVRYNGTKHDGSRRLFATPNIVTYFHIASFIWRNWKKFEETFALSKFSIGKPMLLPENEERAIKVPSLSELSRMCSKNLSFAPYVLRADIAQCFPSLYTHSIAWAAHGIEQSKNDVTKESKTNNFNELDFFVRNGQQGNTRGVLVGPDAYRLIAEFVLCRIDDKLNDAIGNIIVGAVRHVDDYYIGLRTEYDALTVLSNLRDVLSIYELNLNDQKTKISSSLEPINDLWALRLRNHLRSFPQFFEHDKLERVISEAVTIAAEIGSDSPIKILFRQLDEEKVYKSRQWQFIEQNIQRIALKHPHSIDYGCLLVAKRKAIGKDIDKEGWMAVASIIIERAAMLNYHHELLWMLWLLIVCEIEISSSVVDELSKCANGHVRAMLVQAYVDGRIEFKPKLNLGSRLSTVGSSWLENLVARSQQFSKASFSGLYTPEFQHLANRNIALIDFDDHISRVENEHKRAISRARYGYDDEDEGGDDLYSDLEDDFDPVESSEFDF